MILLLRFINSVYFLLINLGFSFYIIQRVFRGMREHNKLLDELTEFNNLVDQSRSSIEFVSGRLMDAINEMEYDIGKELYITHNLTILSEKISYSSKRFRELEESVIELARLNENAENATVETPSDINEEVRRILKRKSAVNLFVRQDGEDCEDQHATEAQRNNLVMDEEEPEERIVIADDDDKTLGDQDDFEPDYQQRYYNYERVMQKPLKRQPTRGIDVIHSQPNPVSAFSSVQHMRQPKVQTPSIVPDVMLLGEQRPVNPRRSPRDSDILDCGQDLKFNAKSIPPNYQLMKKVK